jgi:hypothetical protein
MAVVVEDGSPTTIRLEYGDLGMREVIGPPLTGCADARGAPKAPDRR